MKQVDVIVIGSGQGGVPLAVNLSREGKRVVLFEQKKLGGTCLNVGCYPSKALLAAAHLAGGGRHAAALGIKLTAEVDFARVMDYVRSRTDSTYIQHALDKAGVETVMARASFAAERQVTAAGNSYQAETVIIDTGSLPFVPDIPGLINTPYMTYQSFWQLNSLPRRIIVVGGGYIGVELGQAMARLGSETHIVEKMDRLVAREEPDLSQLLKDSLTEDGVVFHLGSGVKKVNHEEGVFSVALEDGKALKAEALLMAIGQKPNTAALNAAAGGIDLDSRGFIAVDDRFETSCEGVFAIGDVTGQPAFTHVSWEDFRRIMSILKGGERRQGDRVLGYAFFTDPEAARCGLTLAEARQRGLNASSETLSLEHVARAWLTGRTNGFYRLVVDNDSGIILGATLAGPRAGELIHVIIDLMEAGAGWRTLEKAMHIHPTFAEGLPTTARKLL